MTKLFTPSNIALIASYAAFEASNSLIIQAAAVVTLVTVWLARELINAQFAH